MADPSLRILRAPPGLIWRAVDSGQVVGAVSALLRPDDRWFVRFDECREDSYGPLLAAVAANTESDLYVIANEADERAAARYAGLGFVMHRREGLYLIPTDPAITGLDETADPSGVIIISAVKADVEDLRLLDEELRQDVPGTSGWTWDPTDFYEETFDSQFDPATYLIAVDEDSGRYAGLVRVWNSPGWPRLGLIAVLHPYRRRGLARALLARAFRVLHERGKTQVSAEVDEGNGPSRALLLPLGARRTGGLIELVRAHG